MFFAIRKYRVRRGSTAEWAQRVRNGFVPLMRELEGFRGYYLLDGGPDVLITISMFDTADEALASNERAAYLEPKQAAHQPHILGVNVGRRSPDQGVNIAHVA